MAVREPIELIGRWKTMSFTATPKKGNVYETELIKKLRAAYANTKFKPPIHGWRLLWHRIKWYGFHVPRNLYIRAFAAEN